LPYWADAKARHAPGLFFLGSRGRPNDNGDDMNPPAKTSNLWTTAAIAVLICVALWGLRLFE
jgi:hypothetical protein